MFNKQKTLMTRRLSILAALALVWQGCNFAQAAEYNLPIVSSVSALTSRTGKKLGLIYTHEANGTTVSTGTGNVTALNQWGSNTHAKRWSADRFKLDLQGRVAMGGTSYWAFPAVDAVTILTHGLGQPRAELEFTAVNGASSSIQGGMPTGVVWVDKNNLTGRMVLLGGHGGEMGHFRADGNIDTASSTITTVLAGDDANRKEVGIELRDDTIGGYGVGKYHFQSLSINFCVTGFLVTSPSTSENGDETDFDIFKPEYCDVGFKSQHLQCMGMRFGRASQVNTDTMWKYEQGSDFHCSYFFVGGNSTDTNYGLEITGNDSNTSNGVFKFDCIQIDQAVVNDYQAIRVNPTTGYCRAPIVVEYLRVAPNRTTTNNPVIWIKNYYGEVVVRGGENLYEGCLHVEGGIVGAFPTIIIRDAKGYAGESLDSVRNWFDTSSRGYVQVNFEDNTEEHGLTGQVNAGRFYDDNKVFINITGNTTYDLIP
jgi:hypothetical protein